MRTFFETLLGGLLAAAVADGAAAQAVAPASSPASAAAPMTAASKQVPTRNAAVTAAENAKEPGEMRPEERVIPQISVPLKRGGRRDDKAAAASASPAVAVDDRAARCMAAGNATDRAACQRARPASAP